MIIKVLFHPGGGKLHNNLAPPIIVAKLEALQDSFHTLGDIRPFPYRAGNLPKFWYACTGDQYPLGSPQGEALLSLHEDYKLDWGIALNGDYINLPNLLPDEGEGYFARIVDGVTRQVGSRQPDGMRKIEGTDTSWKAKLKSGTPTGPWSITSTRQDNYGVTPFSDASWHRVTMTFDSSLALPNNTADEIRPKNIGFLAAIYLGA